MSKIKFDFIGITESKQQVGRDFINVDMEGYHKYNQPSKSAPGVVVIYVNSSLDHSEIDELSKTDDDFKSLWIEAKNNKNNIICGCIYGHPNTDSVKFIEYIEFTFSKIDCNKRGFLFWEISTLISYNMTVVRSLMIFLLQKLKGK